VAMQFYMGEYEVHKKQDGSLVTTADLEVNRFVLAQLKSRFPNEPVLSEETPDDLARLDFDTVWIVDPIDGTSAFARHSPEFGTLIGRCRAGVSYESVAGFPAVGLMLYACRGSGCFVNGRQTRVSSRPVQEARVSVYGEAFVEFATATRAYRLPALEIVQLCLGEVDGCVLDASHAGEHDYAWAPCAVEEAGGRLTDIFGSPLQFNKRERTVPSVVVAGTREVHASLLPRVRALLGY